MEKHINTLYELYAEQHTDTPEYDRALEKLCKYISDEDYNAIVDGVNAEARQAFQAGFQTAVSLLMGGAK